MNRRQFIKGALSTLAICSLPLMAQKDVILEIDDESVQIGSLWKNKTPDEILSDIDTLLNHIACEFQVPTRMLIGK